MKNEFIAIPVFNDRVSPLLDEARRFMLLEVRDKTVLQKSIVELSAESAALRISRLGEIGVTIIICGAVSGYLSGMISDRKITQYSWIKGQVDDVIGLYLSGVLKPAQNCGKPCRGRGRSCGRA